MRSDKFAVLTFALLLSACSTYTTPRYAINVDTNIALKAIGATSIAVGSFSGPSTFDANCRLSGYLAPPDGMSHTAYLKNALEDELKVAGAYAAASPKTILTGVVTRLEFSSCCRDLTGGSWDVELTLHSSHGKSMNVSEHYEFESGVNTETACKQTSEAYMPTAQNLIGKIVRSPKFEWLLQ